MKCFRKVREDKWQTGNEFQWAFFIPPEAYVYFCISIFLNLKCKFNEI